MSKLSFLDKFDKSSEKMEGVSSESSPPTFFFDTGSAVINKIISGGYNLGYPQGRLTLIAGPANSGKSFLIGNAIKKAQDSGYGVLAIDSENALDSIYLSKLGVDTTSELFNYKRISTIADAKKILSDFFKFYKSAPEEERIPFLITIDSLDELRTVTQAEKDDKGEIHKDMGLKAKELSEILSMAMHNVADLPMAVIATKQPYANQDTYTNKQSPWVITSKLRFAFTQILLVTNRLLKDRVTNKYEGINLQVYGEKTRLTKPFQKCIVEVPYETGMDWYSGVLDAAEAVGVVTRAGAWYTFGDTKFQRKNFDEHKDDVFKALVESEANAIVYEAPEDIDE